MRTTLVAHGPSVRPGSPGVLHFLFLPLPYLHGGQNLPRGLSQKHLSRMHI